MEGKINQRVMLTKRLLKDSLIEMLKTENIYKISVRDLCERAGINRSTFYKYYGDPFDLIIEMENSFIAMVENQLSNVSLLKSFSLLCKYLDENVELGRLLLNNNIDPAFPQKIFALPQVESSLSQRLGTGHTEAEYEYLKNFLIYGIYQVLLIWLNKENRESPEEIANLLMNQVNKLFSK